MESLLTDSLDQTIFSTGIFVLRGSADQPSTVGVAPLWWVFVLTSVILTIVVVLAWGGFPQVEIEDQPSGGHREGWREMKKDALQTAVQATSVFVANVFGTPHLQADRSVL